MSMLLIGAPQGLSDNHEHLDIVYQRPAALPFTAYTLHIFTIFAEMASGTRTAAAWWMLRR